MARTYLKLFLSFNRDVSALTMEERGRLITAIVNYAETGEVDESTLTGNERILFPMFRHQQDREAEAYKAQVRQNRLNGAKGGRPPKAQNNPAGFSETEKSQDEDEEEDEEKEKEEDKEKEKEEGEGESEVWASPEGPDGPGPAPALDDVLDYCLENALNVDALTFWNYYEANGWTAGGRPIRNWQAKLREWNARDGNASPRSQTRSEPVNPALDYEQREYRDEEFGADFFALY